MKIYYPCLALNAGLAVSAGLAVNQTTRTVVFFLLIFTTVCFDREWSKIGRGTVGFPILNKIPVLLESIYLLSNINTVDIGLPEITTVRRFLICLKLTENTVVILFLEKTTVHEGFAGSIEKKSTVIILIIKNTTVTGETLRYNFVFSC